MNTLGQLYSTYTGVYQAIDHVDDRPIIGCTVKLGTSRFQMLSTVINVGIGIFYLETAPENKVDNRPDRSG